MKNICHRLIGILLFFPYFLFIETAFPALIAPIYSGTIETLFQEFNVDELQLSRNVFSKELVVEATISSAKTIEYSRGALPANEPLVASTLYGHLIIHMTLVYIILLLVFPWRTTTICLLPFSAMFVATLSSTMDIPLVLMGATLDLILINLQPEQLKSTPVIIWMHMMNSGGRFILAFAVSIFCAKAILSIKGSPPKPTVFID